MVHLNFVKRATTLTPINTNVCERNSTLWHQNIKILYKYMYYIDREGDSRKYHPKECDYHPFSQCKIHFIKLNRALNYLFFLPFTIVSGVQIGK